MSVMRKGFVVSGGQVLFALLSVAAGILYARKLGPDGMGQFELFRTTRSIATTLFTLGLGMSAIYHINTRKVPLEQAATSIFKISLLTWAVLAVLLTALIRGFPAFFGDVLPPVAAAYAFGVGGNAAMCLLRPVLMARLEARKFALVNLAMPASLLICGAAAALLGLLNTAVAMVLLSVSALASLTVLILYLRPHISLSRPIDWPLVGRLAGYGLPLMAGDVLIVLAGSVAVLLLRYLKPDAFEAVGLFTRATAVAALISLVPSAVRPLLYSNWAGMRGEVRSRQVEMAARMAFTFGVAVAILIALFGRYLIVLLYGEAFEPAAAALDILVLGTPFVALSTVSISLLCSDGRALVVTCILAATVTIVTHVAWLLIPDLGIQGAAISSLCGNAFTALAGIWQCSRLFQINPLNCLLLRSSDLRAVGRILMPGPAAGPPSPSPVAGVAGDRREAALGLGTDCR